MHLWSSTTSLLILYYYYQYSQDGTGVLVYYERSDTQGPKLSDYSLVDLATEKACDEMKKILEKLNGISGLVEKTRHLYMVGQSRVHIDKVTGLGDFLEIEVQLIEELLKNQWFISYLSILFHIFR